MLLLLALTWMPLNSSAASPPQKGFELSGTPRPEFLLEELRALVGRKLWVRRPEPGQPPKALFCESQAAPATSGNSTACASEKYGAPAAEQFTVEDLIISKPNAAYSWLKIKFASGKTAYLSTEDFKDNRYAEGRISADLLGIDYAIANSGWIFYDYPQRILDLRRAQHGARNDPMREAEQLEKERVTRLKLLYTGMTTQQVLNSSWGQPNNITTTVLGWQRLEQWDYGAGTVLYFEDGRLQRIQTFRR
ncbi:MAG TPA: hypothetical protein VK642_15720 [Burkholderiales bacterium]|nr:hypothetical protein [Burkholderiales bacterium]